MSPSLLFILGISIVSLLVMFICIVKWRNHLTLMSGMMISMATGMTSGILGGITIGYYFSGNLFMSTILGSLTGITIGFLTGIPLGLLPVLDGMLSGLMAGMMGAMLGDMIPVAYSEALFKVFFIIYMAVHFIVLYLLFSEVEVKEKKGHLIINLFKNPKFAGGSLIILGFTMDQIDAPKPAMPSSEQHSHSNNNEMINSGQVVKDSSILRITAKDFAYTPENIKMKSGVLYTMVLSNTGADEHDINVVNLNDISRQGNDDSQALFHLHAKAGEEAKAEIKLEKSGEYYFYCTIPGHKEAGMVGNLAVS
ncbi:hypothetical protein ELQ35_02290 [Peribacillus cavernae]|uniref:Blue (type 1) copper domain-containing protein n=1 Tax=Peribacillus cavernae TaxID=1674310 RepID=A0A433HUQ2_9BACI|nr:cupredoxin domain-containing protein [Peribacillus cavernae]MDQ0219977.1 putative cupredoxin-like copper-binding protein [Peribacillus cavernae]RUQ32042.1 hypothetical protein ELQ35_02290 [Peribacillus cavernae]